MEEHKLMPRIIVVGMTVMIFGATLAVGSYILEIVFLKKDETPMFDLFADAFKVGLGAFIGVNSQWATQVFKRSPQPADSDNA